MKTLLRPVDWIVIATLALATMTLMTVAASAQQSPPNRARYYYGGEPHVGPASVGSMYDASGRKVGQSYTDSQGSTTIYGPGGNVTGRTATDSQGTTTFYDVGGRETGRAALGTGAGQMNYEPPEIKVPNPYGRTSRMPLAKNLASRLISAVKPTVVITGDDGQQYDVWEVLIAFLDRMEKSALAPEQEK